jgi:hypothetical protein
VDVEHRVDVGRRHVVKGAVADDAGVVDDDVDPAERRQGGVDDGLAAFGCGDRVGVGHGHAAGGLDLGDHLLGRPRRGALAVDAAPEIVDHDLGAPGGQQQGVGPAEPAAGAGHDRHPPVEPQLGHRPTPPLTSESFKGY